MAAKTDSNRPDSNQAIGIRLAQLRDAYAASLGRKKPLSQSEMARLCDIGVTAYNNWERGRARIGLSNAMRIRERMAVPLDFIYFGNRIGIPHAISVELEKIELADSARPAKRGAPPRS